MFYEPNLEDKYHKTLVEEGHKIEVDVWENRLTKKKYLMVYVHPIGTYIGDDLWEGFKMKYSDFDDYDSFKKKLFMKYKKSIADNKRKGKLVKDIS